MRVLPVTCREAARKKNIFFALFKKEALAKEEIFSYLPASHQAAIKKLISEEFKAEEGETKSIWFPKGPIKRIRLFGLGERSKWNERKSQLLPRRMVRYALVEERVDEFAVAFREDAMRRVAINMQMAHFEFNKYKEKPKGGWPEVKNIFLAVPAGELGMVRKKINEETIVGEEVNGCRILANTPGGDMTPQRLAEEAVAAGKKAGFSIKILGEKEMKRLGMGGVLGVAQGSQEKPRFIIMEYLRGPKDQKPLMLVGKGVTFDTGGLNIKSENSIYEMHMDMSGGAAVIHGLAAIARLKLSINAIGIVPAVENMPSGSSYRPGDLLKTMSGKTIEVLNTDAEGRVILSDALWYGATKYKPGLMADFATLTGAAHVALGNYCSAVFTNRDSLQTKLIEVGLHSGDYVWPLPLWDEYLSEIKGTFGDVANLGSKDRWGGAIHGAKFLEQFVGNTPWAHFDIAPRMTAVEGDHLSKGATGVGVRYIVDLAKEYASGSFN